MCTRNLVEQKGQDKKNALFVIHYLFFYIDSDIKKAETLPAQFYKSQAVFDKLKEAVFVKSWQWIGDEDSIVPLTENVYPFVLLENYLTEPLLVVRDKENQIKCLTNVCTHRGNLVIHNPGKAKNLICMYHGRRFGLDGKFKNMPEFNTAENFPRACDSLHEFPLKKLGTHLFVGLDPAFDF